MFVIPITIVALNILPLVACSSAASRCASLPAPKIPGIKILSVEGTYRQNYTIPMQPSQLPTSLNPDALTGIEFCDVTIYLSHPGVDDRVKLSVWLPHDEKWNGRFQATGGGGFATGLFELMTTQAAKDGFSAASTDGGHSGDSGDARWALNEDGTINLPLFKDFASRSLKDMAVIGKAVTEKFYGKPPHHSYWYGCSTGGRQGYMLAQKYPDLFDGILANAPAIHMSKFVIAEMWPQIVMQQSQTFLSPCAAETFVNASLEACDELDDVKDGVIMDPLACEFDPTSIVGQEASCEGKSEIITEAMAEVVKKIAEGPKSSRGDRLWYGLPPSTPYSVLANTQKTDGKLTGAPFPISENLIKYLVLRDPAFDWKTISYDDFAWIYSQSTTRLGWIIDAENPDLSSFRNSGGKLITYHGLTDEFIPVGGTIQYRQRVEDEMGGLEAVDDFYRLFLAPGVGHCGLPPSPGPVPDDPMTRLVAWVEEGKAPDVLHASITDHEGDLVERDICRYPYGQEYTGKDPKTSSGWKCSGKIMAGLKTANANLDSVYWNIPLPEKSSLLKWLKSKINGQKKDEL